MEIVTLLIGLALILVVVMIWAFFWAVKSGQFDDMEGPAHRIIMEEDQRPEQDKESEAEHQQVQVSAEADVAEKMIIGNGQGHTEQDQRH